MTDKQRADHVQAKYWNGFITRVEAQKVFDETAKVITAQGQVLQKLDAVVSFMAIKAGVTADDVNVWVTEQLAKAAANEKAAATDNQADGVKTLDVRNGD